MTIVEAAGARIATIHQLQTLLRAARLDQGLTQQAVADAAGVSRRWLSDFERGATTAVELPSVMRVLGALQLTLAVTPSQPAANALEDAGSRSKPGREGTGGPKAHRRAGLEAEPVDLDALLARYGQTVHD